MSIHIKLTDYTSQFPNNTVIRSTLQEQTFLHCNSKDFKFPVINNITDPNAKFKVTADTYYFIGNQEIASPEEVNLYITFLNPIELEEFNKSQSTMYSEIYNTNEILFANCGSGDEEQSFIFFNGNEQLPIVYKLYPKDKYVKCTGNCPFRFHTCRPATKEEIDFYYSFLDPKEQELFNKVYEDNLYSLLFFNIAD